MQRLQSGCIVRKRISRANFPASRFQIEDKADKITNHDETCHSFKACANEFPEKSNPKIWSAIEKVRIFQQSTTNLLSRGCDTNLATRPEAEKSDIHSPNSIGSASRYLYYLEIPLLLQRTIEIKRLIKYTIAKINKYNRSKVHSMCVCNLAARLQLTSSISCTDPSVQALQSSLSLS